MLSLVDAKRQPTGSPEEQDETPRKRCRSKKEAYEVSSDEFKTIGAVIMNQKGGEDQSKFDRRFVSHFGVDSLVYADVWDRLDISNRKDGDVNLKVAEPKHLLWAGLFLHVYDAESVLAGMADCHEDTFRKWAWIMIDLISALEFDVIRFENRNMHWSGQDCRMTVDGTDYQVTRQGHPQAMYSHKFKDQGLRYEVGVCIQTGWIVWINGPYPCGDWPDIKIFRQHLKEMLEEGERVEADDGYGGDDPAVIKTPAGIRYMDSKAKQKARHNVRARHEMGNHVLKCFQVLRKIFHHDMELHSGCFRACAVLVQLSFELGVTELWYDVAEQYMIAS